MIRSGNPALSKKTFENLKTTANGVMTLDGAINKTENYVKWQLKELLTILLIIGMPGELNILMYKVTKTEQTHGITILITAFYFFYALEIVLAHT